MHDTNRLISELSPYLLQHARNPVDWYPWGQEALEKARAENKLIILSIGYAACHWCHVIEHESFEDNAIAAMMNESFVCIKVDREERPDIDQIYMHAVQLVTGRGGWPLHAFLLPDGRPFYGGTYFRPGQWTALLGNISETWKERPWEIEDAAGQVMIQMDAGYEMRDAGNTPEKKDLKEISNAIERWMGTFDRARGGARGAPKFPMPVHYLLLLRFFYLTRNEDAFDIINTSLREMAFGGIYDQIGGGFARYATDEKWTVPHFEKMLYDNAKLVSLYAEAYACTGDTLYRDVVYETLGFISREMTSAEGAFFSSLDADSESVEGKYYLWGEEARVYMSDIGCRMSEFENGEYIILRELTIEEMAIKEGLDPEPVRKKTMQRKQEMLELRNKKVRPGLDDKVLTSWNALMAKAYFDAYRVFAEEDFFTRGKKNIDFLLDQMRKDDGGLWHRYRNGEKGIEGFLEDYAFLTEALLAFPPGRDNRYLYHARTLMFYVLSHFSEGNTGLFHFTGDHAEKLVKRSTEVYDNVIPSSNSSLARSFLRLGNIFGESSFLEKSEIMYTQMVEKALVQPGTYANWLILMMEHLSPLHVIAVSGTGMKDKLSGLNEYYLPLCITVGSEEDCFLPVLKNRFVPGKTLIYVCSGGTCQLPVEHIGDVMNLISARK